MYNIPSEFNVGGVYMPPLLVATLLGLAAASLTAKMLNRYRLSRLFYYPPLAFIGFVVIYTCVIGMFVIPF